MHIISARTDYEPRYPGDTTKWKLHAFKHVKQNFDQNVYKYIYIYLIIDTYSYI